MIKRFKKVGWRLVLALLPMAVVGQQADTLRVNLETALQVALSDNPMIQIAGQEIKRVDYSKKEAWHGLIPTVSGAGQLSKYAIPAKMSMMGIMMDNPANYMGSGIIWVLATLHYPFR